MFKSLVVAATLFAGTAYAEGTKPFDVYRGPGNVPILCPTNHASPRICATGDGKFLMSCEHGEDKSRITCSVLNPGTEERGA